MPEDVTAGCRWAMLAMVTSTLVSALALGAITYLVLDWIKS